MSPPEPADIVATELHERGVPVPVDCDDAYTEAHVDVPASVEVLLPEHGRVALESRRSGDRFDDENAVQQAVPAAFDHDVETRTGATEAVAAAAELVVDRSRLVHVGDDPRTDGAAAGIGASAALIDDVPLWRTSSLLEANVWPP